MAPTSTWTRLIRFIAEEDGQTHLGEVDATQYPDIGLSVVNGERVAVRQVTGCIFDGIVTEKILHVARLLAPIDMEDVPLIRCMGLNYRDHAKEANMPIPDVPVLFIKPRTALNGPHPAMINVPQIAQDGTSDYEAELAVILSRTGRDIPECDAMDYVLGYTCSNDVSARTQQFLNSQWSFSKGLDGSCPLGPVLVAPSELDPHQLDIKAIHNGSVVQDSNTREMIFDIPKIIAFLSQGTTLERGTVIMTGTGPGIGAMRNPKVVLRDGDDIRVQIQGIGTLYSHVLRLSPHHHHLFLLVDYQYSQQDPHHLPRETEKGVWSALRLVPGSLGLWTPSDRTYPHCLVCEQTDNTCTYPAGPLKPGPKIGSLRTRKRARATADSGHERPAGAAVAWLDEGEYASNIHSESCVPDSKGASTVIVGASVQNGSTPAEAKALDLSFILHPSHVSSPPNKETTGQARHSPDSVHTTQLAMQRAHAVLGVAQDEAEQLHLIDTSPSTAIYFDQMMTISLFHQPSFPEKLARITSPTQMAALMAAMFAFAVRRTARFLNVALQQIDEALDECGDDTPPLCLLQACVLAAHCQLTQGVLGRAWRTLGSCVRLAYEMNLHLVDVQGPRHAAAAVDIAKWCSDEEQRRAWWAIWEMDVFATTIRRTPTAIDWSQIEILLPVDDEHWFQCQPQESCFFEPDPIRRWKVLESCGNQSPKAWFIVINSLMKEAQRISSPRGIPSRSQSDQVDKARHQLEIIANSIQCFQLALPDHLKYKNQDLTFDSRSARRLNSAVYNIHMMTHLARLMVYRYDVFKGRVRVSLPSHDHQHEVSSNSRTEGEHAAVREYFDAADRILGIIHRSSADHIQYIMPFLSSTIWLASAVQLMRSQLCRSGTLKSVVKSRYEVLHLTYKKCVQFWDMHPAVQQSLETLEKQLEACKQAESTTSATARRQDSTDPAPAFPSPAQSNIVAPTSDWQSEPGPGGGMMNEGSMLDPIALQSMNCQPLPSQFLSSATLVDPMFLFGTNTPSVDFTRLWEMGPQAEWATTRLDVQSLP
ncbi:hypothetical protein BDW67DRAFT_178620 [Aspergillus spinulosporus]